MEASKTKIFVVTRCVPSHFGYFSWDLVAIDLHFKARRIHKIDFQSTKCHIRLTNDTRWCFQNFQLKKFYFLRKKKWFNNWLVSEPFTWGKTLGDKMNANDIFNHCSSRDLRSIVAEWKRRNLITALESLRNLIWTARTETSGTRTKNSFHFSCLFMSSANEWRGDERTENNILTRLFNFERKAEGKNINKRWMRPKLQKTNRW